MPAARAEPLRIVAFGDSLMAGYNLPQPQGFPARLEAALKAKGHDIAITDAGVSGDTASAGLARIDWSVPDGTQGVILELGANDMLRGVSPTVTRNALDGMLTRLKQRNIEVLFIGMRAPNNFGREFVTEFDRIYPELAARHGVLFYPFFIEGIALDDKLNQKDGIHPTAAGIDVIVQRIMPITEKFIEQIKTKHSKQ